MKHLNLELCINIIICSNENVHEKTVCRCKVNFDTINMLPSTVI